LASGTQLGTLAMAAALLTSIGIAATMAFAAWERTTKTPVDQLIHEERPVTRSIDAILAEAAAADTPLRVERELDRLVLQRVNAGLGTREQHDALPDNPARVDFVQQGTMPTVSAVLIDLDRDGRIDERWQVIDAITRDVSPADDENYTETYTLDRGSWIRPGQSAAARAPTGPAYTAIDETVLSMRGRDIGAPQIKDMTPGFPSRVALFQDPGEAGVNRAHVDLDRDGNWDERWTLGDEVTRERSPGDDEEYTETQRWTGSGWASQ